VDTAHEALPYSVLQRIADNGDRHDTLIELAVHVGDLVVRGSVELLRNLASLLADYRDLGESATQDRAAASAPTSHSHLVLGVMVEIVHAATHTKERRNVDQRERLKIKLFEEIDRAGEVGYTQSDFIAFVQDQRAELTWLRVSPDLAPVEKRKLLKGRVYELFRKCLRDGSLQLAKNSPRIDGRERPMELTDHGRHLYSHWTGQPLFSTAAVGSAAEETARTVANIQDCGLLVRQEAGVPGAVDLQQGFQDVADRAERLEKVFAEPNMVVKVLADDREVFERILDTPVDQYAKSNFHQWVADRCLKKQLAATSSEQVDFDAAARAWSVKSDDLRTRKHALLKIVDSIRAHKMTI
jgi:hypothetical protein